MRTIDKITLWIHHLDRGKDGGSYHWRQGRWPLQGCVSGKAIFLTPTKWFRIRSAKKRKPPARWTALGVGKKGDLCLPPKHPPGAQGLWIYYTTLCVNPQIYAENTLNQLASNLPQSIKWLLYRIHLQGGKLSLYSEVQMWYNKGTKCGDMDRMLLHQKFILSHWKP